MRVFAILTILLVASEVTFAAGLNLIGTNDIRNGSVTNALLANVNNSTVKCNVSGSSGTPQDCTAAQAATLVNSALGALIGANNLSDINNITTTRVNLGFPNIGTGSVLFGSGSTLPSTDGQLSWDNTNKSLSVSKIQVGGYTTTGGVLVNDGTNFVGSVVPTPPCSAISASQIDWSLGNCFTKTLSANTTLTFVKQMPGQMITIRVTNTNNNYTLTFPNTAGAGTSVLWQGSAWPTLSTGQHSDIFTIFFDGTNYYGAAPAQNY